MFGSGSRLKKAKTSVRTGAKKRNGLAMAPITVVWLTWSNTLADTSVPPAYKRAAKPSVLRWGLTSESLAAASNRVRGALLLA